MEMISTLQANCISCLTVEEIQVYLKQNQSLIVPLGGLEPFGSVGATGVSGLCSEHLSKALAYECGSLVAPLIPFSSSPLFKSFSGCASMGTNVYESVIIHLCECWRYQGFERILLVNSAFTPDKALDLAMKRLNVRGPEYVDVKVYSWQQDRRVMEKVHDQIPGTAFDRLESALLSIASDLDKNMVRNSIEENHKNSVSIDEYKRWKKRGADPQKFRKLFRSGITSDIPLKTDTNLGKALFRYILDSMMHDYSTFLRANSDNAS